LGASVLTSEYRQDPVVAVPEEPELSSVEFRLDPDTPNPFNPSTEVSFSLAIGGRTVVTVHDLRGADVLIRKISLVK
jgi:hypothetical protein